MPNLTYDPPEPQIGDSELVIARKTAVNISRIADAIATGAVHLKAISVGNNFAFLTTDFARYIDATGGSITGQLPVATGSGQIFLAVKIDDTNNVVTIAPNGLDLIDGSTSLNLVNQWSDCLIQDFSAGYWHSILGI